MYLAGNMVDAMNVAELLCDEWLFVATGETYTKAELELLAEAFDATTPLAEEDFFMITEDGSIGIMYPNAKEPDWHFVSPAFAASEILNMTPEQFKQSVEATKTASVKKKFCGNCGAPLDGGKFCSNCGAKL